jgi:hypothetical protein
MSTSDDASQCGKSLAAADQASLSTILNDSLTSFIGDDYKVVPGYLIDLDGRQSAKFASVIHTSSVSLDPADACAVLADTTAAVIDVCDELNVERFQGAYGRIADVKRLRKTPVSKDEPNRTNVTLGVVLAARSAVSLEIIAEELDRLNSKTPCRQWPDMIIIASTGVINYGVQFPGESISGDYLPPAEGAFKTFVPSVRSDPGQVIIQKYADEGSSSPFMARIFLGVMRLRDAVNPVPATRLEFDNRYEVVLSALTNARTASQNISRIWDEHTRKLGRGEIVRQQGTAIHISETIDKDLRREVENFLNAATRALKVGMQNIGKFLNVDIGFLFQKRDTFERAVAKLEKTEPDLAEYLRHTRIWSEPMLKSRNDLEHEPEVLSRVTYMPAGTGALAQEPAVAGMPVTEFVNYTFDRLTCFVEEFAAHCLMRQLPAGITITELSPAERLAEAPERFRLTLASGGLPPWRIAFHTSRFEDT